MGCLNGSGEKILYFQNHLFLLNDISAKVLNPKQLLEEKEVYEQIGRKPREKDAESKKILRQIINGIKY